MKPGQRLTRWWQEYVAGRLRSPQCIHQAALAEAPDPATPQDAFFGRDQPIRWQAPQRLRAPNFMRTEAFLRQWDRADWQHVDPRIMRWAAKFQLEARKRAIPLYVHNAFRTLNEQREMAARGVSKTLHSAHNIGEAVDIVHGVFHWEMTRQEWSLLGVLGRQVLDRLNAPLRKAERLELQWGGDWSFYDPAHWEIIGWQDRFRELPVADPVRYTPSRILRLI